MNRLDTPRAALSHQDASDPLSPGIHALEAGEKEEARRQFAQAVLADPNHAEAWLWLGRCMDDESQRQECWQRARQLNQRRTDWPALPSARSEPEAPDVGQAFPVWEPGTQGEIEPPAPAGNTEPPARRTWRQAVFITLAALALALLAAVGLWFGRPEARVQLARAQLAGLCRVSSRH